MVSASEHFFALFTFIILFDVTVSLADSLRIIIKNGHCKIRCVIKIYSLFLSMELLYVTIRVVSAVPLDLRTLFFFGFTVGTHFLASLFATADQDVIVRVHAIN